MYTVDERDRVAELTDLPRSSVGAPCPVVFASEHSLHVAYFVRARDAAWDGTYVRVVGGQSSEPAAVVRFERPYAQFLGPPNDEAFAGHPLAPRGLAPYRAYEVFESSWIRALERRNRVHPSHHAAHFAAMRHFVLAFHDSTFECVASGYSFERDVGPLGALVTAAAARESARPR